MRKKFILFKYDYQGHSLIYVSSLSSSSVEFTPKPALAKRYNVLAAFVLGLLYNYNWINEKHTQQ
jgi:hypothetical protein